MTGRDGTPLAEALAAALESRGAVAFAHAGPDRDPAIRYCRSAAAGSRSFTDGSASRAADTRAIAFDGAEWYAVSSDRASGHPADDLAAKLAERVGTGTVLTPARIPHDAALYLERAGFSLASTDAVERARSKKMSDERARIEAAQSAAAAGLRRGGALLADATVEDGRLVAAGRAVTADRLRRTIDEAIVAAGGFPDRNTAVTLPDRGAGLRPGEPIVVAVAPRESTGYYGGLVRTLVVDSEGGEERRAHVGVTQAFRSARAMLTADAHSVTAVEADLEAEIRGFGFGERPIETRVAGVGLESAERPRDGGDRIESRSVVRIEAAVEFAPDRWIRLADLLARADAGVEWLAAPSRSIAPSAYPE
ncbi:M24 family metallopeptidase [Halosolutus gelatinilyticus]|uniref:M24 family metallopeptidase n=1 Tax=Halosolutus gelatinilyticus TaxID=2931975 RepID=UPI001FF2FAC9|nr:M24 family metallopeptidase [Halosolutus gelatinilyticus]